ncbi:hypothetical protein MOE92_20915 [Bacillus spizizenii]|nr:hypothetical protein [Bacillus spizizenii]
MDRRKNEDFIELIDILQSLHSQLRIIQTCGEDAISIDPGKQITYGITPPITQSAGHVADGDLNLNGISPLNGKVPVVQGVPISINVEWEIKDSNSKPLIEGEDFVAPNGLNCPQVNLIFKPVDIIEYTNSHAMLSNSLLTEYTLHANVTLITGDTFVKGEIPPATLSILPLTIPTMYTVFKNEHFTSMKYKQERSSKALIMVPTTSLIRSKEDVLKYIDILYKKAITLSFFSDFYLLKLSLETLHNVLSSQNELQIQVGNEFNLTEIFLEENDIGSDEYWADKIDSFIFIGPPKRTVICRNNQNVNDRDKGKFKVTIKTNYVLTRRLDNIKPETEPFNDELNVEINPENTFSNAIKVIQYVEENSARNMRERQL